MILCDTNILIDLFRLHPLRQEQVRPLLPGRLAISLVTTAELIKGARNNQELSGIRRNLAICRELPLSGAIGQRALELMWRYNLSQSLDFADALIAATALEYGLPLFTLNRKHFQYLPGLNLYEA
jgi:tRNA(fMet)-specific endonuclease VapC